jgi:hypothetical protein
MRSEEVLHMGLSISGTGSENNPIPKPSPQTKIAKLLGFRGHMFSHQPSWCHQRDCMCVIRQLTIIHSDACDYAGYLVCTDEVIVCIYL